MLGRNITSRRKPRVIEGLIDPGSIARLMDEVAYRDTILVTQTPRNAAPEELASLFRKARFTFVYDGGNSLVTSLLRRKIMLHCVPIILGCDAKVLIPGSIGTVEYDVIRLNQRKIVRDWLFHNLSCDGVTLQRGIKDFVLRTRDGSVAPEEHTFFSSPRRVVPLLQKFFVAQGNGATSYLGETARFVEIMRLYEVNGCDSSNISQILDAGVLKVRVGKEAAPGRGETDGEHWMEHKRK